jgi:hypothetical protein
LNCLAVELIDVSAIDDVDVIGHEHADAARSSTGQILCVEVPGPRARWYSLVDLLNDHVDGSTGSTGQVLCVEALTS